MLDQACCAGPCLQLAGAIGVIVVASPGQDIELMLPRGGALLQPQQPSDRQPDEQPSLQRNARLHVQRQRHAQSHLQPQPTLDTVQHGDSVLADDPDIPATMIGYDAWLDIQAIAAGTAGGLANITLRPATSQVCVCVKC